VSLPDTPENQARYPQRSGQKAGLGFPIARIVGLMSLASGAVLNAAIGPFKGKGTGESALCRQMSGGLNAGDIVVADRYFGSYWFIADRIAQGIDVVLGQHGARKCDFRKGQRLGTRDHIVIWEKPAQRPEWMTPEQYAAYPATLSVRECRVRKKNLVTTFLSDKAVPKAELARLYEHRWQVELALRNLKTTLGMEQLRCMTPDMNEKEIWVYLLAYDLIRLLMCQAAVQAGILPRTISSKHTLQFWLAWIRYPVNTFDQEQLRMLFLLIAQQRVGNRPGRIEPRAVKRRPKPHPLLMKPRAVAREHIRKHGHPKKLK
jgi:hypothetical protein